MTEFELFRQAHAIVRAAFNAASGSEERNHLGMVREALWHRGQFHRSRCTEPDRLPNPGSSSIMSSRYARTATMSQATCNGKLK